MRYYLALIFALNGLFVCLGQQQDCKPNPNTRTHVADATQAPYRYICLLEVYRQKTLTKVVSKHPLPSTGFLISPNVILTAGHSVYEKWDKVTRLVVRPFINGVPTPNNGIEFDGGKLTLQPHPKYRRHKLFPNKRNPQYDFGAIILPTDTIFKLTHGHFLWDKNYLHSAQQPGDLANIAGYPSDTTDYILMQQTGRIVKVKPQSLRYDFYTRGGNSGSPIWVVVNGQTVVIGIHNTGTSSGTGCNKGARINEDVYNLISGWMK